MSRGDWIDRLFADAGVVELRHQDGDRWTSGIFDTPACLRDCVEALRDRGNLYTTLNAPRDVEVTNAMTAQALRDADIGAIVRLPFDFDPARPAGMSSTDAELLAARQRRDRMVAALHGYGWPAPAMAISGNGAHAVYRCRLPATDATREMLAALYRGLKSDHGDDDVAFDASVRNPARIWRLYGTANRKGQATAERPHRLAVVAIPARWAAVSPRALEALANVYARRSTARAASTTAKVVGVVGVGDYRTLDVVAWLSAHGLYKRALGDGRHALWCPWRGEHTTPSTPVSTDTVAWSATDSRWPTFHCSHAHCEGRGIVDVMRLLGDADRYCQEPYRRVA